jgi:hypothetical protein
LPSHALAIVEPALVAAAAPSITARAEPGLVTRRAET